MPQTPAGFKPINLTGYKDITPPTFKPIDLTNYKDISPPQPIGKSHGWLADTAWNIGKGALDITGVSDSPIKQFGKSIQAYENLQKLNPTEQDKISKQQNEEYMANLENTLSSPWHGAKAAANYLDPTGTVPGYMDLGEAMVGDIHDRNWKGLAGHTALGALPFILPSVFKGAKKVLGKVPSVEPIPGVTEPRISIADKIRLQAEQDASVVRQARLDKAAKAEGSSVVDYIARKNAEKAAKVAARNSAKQAKVAPTILQEEVLPQVDTTVVNEPKLNKTIPIVPPVTPVTLPTETPAVLPPVTPPVTTPTLETAPVKRGRGRPKKAVEAKVETATENKDVSIAEFLEKRKAAESSTTLKRAYTAANNALMDTVDPNSYRADAVNHLRKLKGREFAGLSPDELNVYDDIVNSLDNGSKLINDLKRTPSGVTKEIIPTTLPKVDTSVVTEPKLVKTESKSISNIPQRVEEELAKFEKNNVKGGFRKPGDRNKVVIPETNMTEADIEDLRAIRKNKAREDSFPEGGDFSTKFKETFPDYADKFKKVVGYNDGAYSVKLKDGGGVIVGRDDVINVPVKEGIDYKEGHGYGSTVMRPERFNKEGNFIPQESPVYPKSEVTPHVNDPSKFHVESVSEGREPIKFYHDFDTYGEAQRYAERMGKNARVVEPTVKSNKPTVHSPGIDNLKSVGSKSLSSVETSVPKVEPVKVEPSLPTEGAGADKLQSLFNKMGLNEQVEKPKRGRPKLATKPVKETLPPVDTSVIEKPEVEKPVIRKLEAGSLTPKSRHLMLQDAYDAIVREEKAITNATEPLGKRVVARLNEFYDDNYPFTKRRDIEVKEVLKQRKEAADARRLAKTNKPIEEPVVEKPIAAKEELPPVDTSVVKDERFTDPESLDYIPPFDPESKGLNIRRWTDAERKAEEVASKKAVASAERRKAFLEKLKGLGGDEEGSVSLKQATFGLSDKIEKYKANRAAGKASKAANEAVTVADKEFKDKNIEALSKWANTRKANYYKYGDVDVEELKKSNAEASKALLKYLKDTGQIKKDVKHLNVGSWKPTGPEAANIKGLIDAVYSKSWKGLDKTANLVGWTKNMYLSGGVPGTIINAHGLNITRRDYQARGFKKAAKNFAEGVFQPKKGEKFLLENEDIIPELMKEGYEPGTEKGMKGEHYVPFENLLNKTKVTSLIPKGLKLGQKLFEDPLFKRHLPATKLKFALERIDELESKGMDTRKAMRVASEDANIFFGGINKSLRHKNINDLAQIFLLAPDWQESGVRLAGKKIAATSRAVSGKAKLGDSLYTKALGRSTAANVATKAAGLLLGKTLKDYISDPGGSTNLTLGKSGNRERQLEVMGGAAEEFRIPEQILIASLQQDPLRTIGDLLTNRTSQPFQSFDNWRQNVDRFKNPLSGTDRYGKPIPYMKGIGNQALELSKPFQYQSMQALIELLRKRVSEEEAIVKSGEGPFRYKSIK